LRENKNHASVGYGDAVSHAIGQLGDGVPVVSATGALARLRARLRRPGEIAEVAAQPAGGGGPRASSGPTSADATSPAERPGGLLGDPAPDDVEFEHAPDATPDEVPSPKKIGFDGREIPEHAPHSGHTPSGGAMGGGGF
jgi:hypothetical protein